MNESVRAIVGLFVGGLLVGFGSVVICELTAATPKFCGVKFFYTVPFGCALGFIVGMFSSLGRNR